MPRARSEHEPDLTAGAAAALVPLAMHPVTGAFADPTHESAQGGSGAVQEVREAAEALTDIGRRRGVR